MQDSPSKSKYSIAYDYTLFSVETNTGLDTLVHISKTMAFYLGSLLVFYFQDQQRLN